MPRVGSRGVKVTSVFLNRMQQYLSVDEGDLWVRRMRFLYCPEEGLIEQDLLPLLEEFLPNRFTRLSTLIDQTVGGGIGKNAMLDILEEATIETEKSVVAINVLRIPIVEGIV